MRARLSHSFFRRHPAQLILAAVGIAAGMAVVTGVALLREALVDSLDAASAELAGGNAIVIRAPEGRLDTDRYAELAQRPGAPDWVPVQRVPVRHGSTQLEVIGLDGFSAVRNLDDTTAVPAAGLQWSGRGSPPAAMGASTLRLLGLSDQQEFAVEGPNGAVRLTAVQAAAGADRRLLMDIAVARHAFEIHGGLTELLAPGQARDWIDRNLPEDLVATSLEQQRASARQLTEGLRANLTAMSLLALATGLFVVYAVLSFLVVQRRRSFGVLRAIGLTHRDLARMLVQEGLALGALGSLIGLVAGTLLADLLLGLLADPVRSIYGQLALARTQPELAQYLGLFALGLAAAIAVTVPVVVEALRVPPGRILRDDAHRSQRSGPGLLTGLPALSVMLLAAGGLWVALDGRLIAALGGLFLVLAGLALQIPPLGFGLLARIGSRLGHGLAGRSVRLVAGSRARLAPALSALSLALALAMGMGMMILGFRMAVDDWVERLLRADLYVSAPDRRLTPDDVERLRGLPGVEAISTVRTLQLVDGLQLTAYSLPGPAWAGFEWLAGDPGQIRAAFEAGRGVAVSEPLARTRKLDIGDPIDLALPAGLQTLPVVGIFRDYSSDAGFVAADAALALAGFDDARDVDSVGLYPAAGVEAATLERRLSSESRFDALRWIGPKDIRDQSLAVFDRTFRISWAMAVLVGGIALLALVSALLAHGLERAREYATLRALGLEPQRLFGMVVLQTVALTVAAAALAVPLAVLVHYALVLFVQPRAFGWSVPPTLPPIEPIWVVVPAALLCGALAGLLPAARIAGRTPIGALRGR